MKSNISWILALNLAVSSSAIAKDPPIYVAELDQVYPLTDCGPFIISFLEYGYGVGVIAFNQTDSTHVLCEQLQLPTSIDVDIEYSDLDGPDMFYRMTSRPEDPYRLRFTTRYNVNIDTHELNVGYLTVEMEGFDEEVPLEFIATLRPHADTDMLDFSTTCEYHNRRSGDVYKVTYEFVDWADNKVYSEANLNSNIILDSLEIYDEEGVLLTKHDGYIEFPNGTIEVDAAESGNTDYPTFRMNYTINGLSYMVEEQEKCIVMSQFS